MERARIMVTEFDYGLPTRKNVLLVPDVLLPQCIPERRWDYKG